MILTLVANRAAMHDILAPAHSLTHMLPHYCYVIILPTTCDGTSPRTEPRGELAGGPSYGTEKLGLNSDAGDRYTLK